MQVTPEILAYIGLGICAVVLLLPAADVFKEAMKPAKNTVVMGVDLAKMPSDLKITQKVRWIRSQNNKLTQSQANTILAQWEQHRLNS